MLGREAQAAVDGDEASRACRVSRCRRLPVTGVSARLRPRTEPLAGHATASRSRPATSSARDAVARLERSTGGSNRPPAPRACPRARSWNRAGARRDRSAGQNHPAPSRRARTRLDRPTGALPPPSIRRHPDPPPEEPPPDERPDDPPETHTRTAADDMPDDALNSRLGHAT